MNTELLRNVRDAIGAETERFEMNNWITSPKPGESLAGDCGTAGCLAGHIVFEAAKMGLVNGTASGWSSVVMIDGIEKYIAEVALWLVEEDEFSAWRLLFAMGNWPEHYKKSLRFEKETYPERALQAKMAMELIDDILDGLTVYDEAREEWVYLPDDAVAEDEPADA